LFPETESSAIKCHFGGHNVIDCLVDNNAESVSLIPVMLTGGVFYAIKVEYVHLTDKAKIQLLWTSASVARQVVPSRVFYYTRHIGGSSLSPFSIHVAPGDIDTSSSAKGDGLTSCVALEECSFVIQTMDANQNNRHTDGSSLALRLISAEVVAGHKRDALMGWLHHRQL
jgi:hypothetical protein